MAGIEKLKNRIMKDEEDRAKQTENDANLKAQDIIKKAGAKAEEMIEDAKVKGLKMGESRKDRIISSAKLEARDMKLAQKQETVDRILNMADDAIKSMEKDEYTSFLEELLINNIETGEEEIILPKSDIGRIDLSLVDRLNQKLLSQGKLGKLKISSETRDIKSGFLLINGGVEINCSIDSQIRMIRDSIEGELANLLFGDEE